MIGNSRHIFYGIENHADDEVTSCPGEDHDGSFDPSPQDLAALSNIATVKLEYMSLCPGPTPSALIIVVFNGNCVNILDDHWKGVSLGRKLYPGYQLYKAEGFFVAEMTL